MGVLRTYVTRVWSYCMCGPEGQNFDNPVSVACVFRVCHDFHYPPGMYFGCVKHRVECYLIWCTSTDDNHVFRVLQAGSASRLGKKVSSISRLLQNELQKTKNTTKKPFFF